MGASVSPRRADRYGGLGLDPGSDSVGHRGGCRTGDRAELNVRPLERSLARARRPADRIEETLNSLLDHEPDLAYALAREELAS